MQGYETKIRQFGQSVPKTEQLSGPAEKSLFITLEAFRTLHTLRTFILQKTSEPAAWSLASLRVPKCSRLTNGQGQTSVLRWQAA